MPWVPRPLPGTGARVVPLREAVEDLAPGAFDGLPLARRILAEGLVRHGDPASTREHLAQVVLGRSDADFPFFPARVVLQDLLGTPALVDLAGLRDAVADAGGDPSAVNPVVPTQLVVDHSLSVEVDGTHADALRRNMELERRRDAERFGFLSWARRAFRNLEVVMPGNGILHPLHLERLCPVVQVAGGVAFADTVIGTDRHTAMVNALGVLGWGVGGIEAESVMLGRPVWMRLPPVVGVELRGARRPGVQATDLVLALAELLHREGAAGAILELHGEGAAALPVPDRATLSSMAPELGATAALFAVDERTLQFLRLTGRAGAQVHLVEAHARAQGLWAGALGAAVYGRRLSFELGAVGRAVAGPVHPHERVPLERLVDAGIAAPPPAAPLTQPLPPPGRGERSDQPPLPDRAVVIAAITGCTSSANPREVVTAGLLARNAVARGVARKPWVKTSLAPGSRAVEHYLEDAGLLAPLRALGFGVVGFGCTSCHGLCGPLQPAIERELEVRGLAAVAVLSGNRSFHGRIHPRVAEAFVASPALVVAYAIAGSIRADLARGPLATGRDGGAVTLAELWPSDEEVDAVTARHVRPEHFGEVHELLADRPARRGVRVPDRFPWSPASTVLRRPPYWDPALAGPPAGRSMRALALLGDDVTSDDLSPSGAIPADSAAGRYLVSRGVAPAELGSYGIRRGDHLVAIRATLAGPRLRNELAPEVEGAFTRVEPGGPVLPLHDAAERWLARGQELVVIAGRNFGCGSSRDWAAKGLRLLGVRAVVAEGFDGVHRANLVGVGVLPLELPPGTTRRTLGLDGFETYALEGLDGAPEPGRSLTLRIARRDGTVARTPVRCRVDTGEEREELQAGGLLQRIAAGLGAGTRRMTAPAAPTLPAHWEPSMTRAPDPAAPAVLRDLAPSGVLRAAINYGNPVLAGKDPASGEPRGVSVDLAGALARSLGVEVRFVTFDGAGKVFEAAKANGWDVAFLARDPARATEILFTSPYVIIEGTYLVPEGSPFRAVEDLDRPGVRIAVGKGAAYDLFLSRTLKHAQLVRSDTSAGAVELFVRDGLDAAAGVRNPLAAYAAAREGVRVIPGRFTAIEQAMGTIQGRAAGGAFLQAFVEAQKASGFVAAALERHGQKDAVVAPAAPG